MTPDPVSEGEVKRCPTCEGTGKVLADWSKPENEDRVLDPAWNGMKPCPDCRTTVQATDPPEGWLGGAYTRNPDPPDQERCPKVLDVVSIEGTIVEEIGDQVEVEVTDEDGRGVAFLHLPRNRVRVIAVQGKPPAPDQTPLIEAERSPEERWTLYVCSTHGIHGEATQHAGLAESGKRERCHLYRCPTPELRVLKVVPDSSLSQAITERDQAIQDRRHVLDTTELHRMDAYRATQRAEKAEARLDHLTTSLQGVVEELEERLAHLDSVRLSQYGHGNRDATRSVLKRLSPLCSGEETWSENVDPAGA